MSTAPWIALVLACSIGNLALGFLLACFLGHANWRSIFGSGHSTEVIQPQRWPQSRR